MFALPHSAAHDDILNTPECGSRHIAASYSHSFVKLHLSRQIIITGYHLKGQMLYCGSYVAS